MSEGPLHARWWLSVNNEDNLVEGIKLNSISGLGNKDESIDNVPRENVEDIRMLFFDYVFYHKKKVNDHV